jgi:hypothetical protein
MTELILGIVIGAMAVTERGHELGNQAGEAAITLLKSMRKKGKEEDWYDAQNEDAGGRSER